MLFDMIAGAIGGAASGEGRVGKVAAVLMVVILLVSAFVLLFL